MYRCNSSHVMVPSPFLSASLTLPLSVLLLAIYALGMLTGEVLLSLIRNWVQGATKKPALRNLMA